MELLTSDAGAAKAFYAELMGWTYDDLPLPEGGSYTMVLKDGKRVAGLHQPAPENAGPPAWLSYVTVEDADAAAERAKELGATTLAGPFDVMDAGRMAVLQDSQGAVFAVWQPRASIGAELVNDPGSLTMTQLNAADVDTARGFYSSLFVLQDSQSNTVVLTRAGRARPAHRYISTTDIILQPHFLSTHAPLYVVIAKHNTSPTDIISCLFTPHDQVSQDQYASIHCQMLTKHSLAPTAAATSSNMDHCEPHHHTTYRWNHVIMPPSVKLLLKIMILHQRTHAAPPMKACVKNFHHL